MIGLCRFAGSASLCSYVWLAAMRGAEGSYLLFTKSLATRTSSRAKLLFAYSFEVCAAKSLLKLCCGVGVNSAAWLLEKRHRNPRCSLSIRRLSSNSLRMSLLHPHKSSSRNC